MGPPDFGNPHVNARVRLLLLRMGPPHLATPWICSRPTPLHGEAFCAASSSVFSWGPKKRRPFGEKNLLLLYMGRDFRGSPMPAFCAASSSVFTWGPKKRIPFGQKNSSSSVFSLWQNTKVTQAILQSGLHGSTAVFLVLKIAYTTLASLYINF